MDRPFKDTAKVTMNRHHILVKKQTSDPNIVVPFLGLEISISMDRPRVSSGTTDDEREDNFTNTTNQITGGSLSQRNWDQWRVCLVVNFSAPELVEMRASWLRYPVIKKDKSLSSRSRMVRKLACGLVLIACGLILLKKTDVGVVLIFRTNYSDVNVGITYVGTAVAKGAVCLDGSPPAYHLDKGFGAGRNKWLVHHEGGGWCSNMSTCLFRKDTRLGSSKKMEKLLPFIGILSSQRKFNPDFYNWNRVLVRYCDGASFTGDVEEVDPDTNLHFRGSRVFVAVMEELLAKGMKTAQDALLTGCSAGGLTVTLHCDQFRALLPQARKVKCVIDAAYFVNVKDISGARHIETYYNDVVKTHGSANNLPPSCTSKRNPGLCFFQQNIAKLVETPLFVVNSAYDSWQIPNILAPDTADPDGRWHDCKFNLTKCSTDQLKTIQDFRLMFLDALKELGSSSSRGIFIDSCYEHDQITVQETWLSDDSPALDGTKMAKAVGDWYNDKYPFQKIDDCSYPCKNCPSFKHTL